MKILCCPKCLTKFVLKEKSLICENGHSFDIAKEGYVNLLLTNKSCKNIGDNADMILSRNKILEKGYYDKLCDAITFFMKNNNLENASILDIGCGEGFLTRQLKNQFLNSNIAGVDISKPAIRLASKKCKKVEYAVANATNLPIRNQSLDVVINSFAPLSNDESLRILKTNGFFVKIIPNVRHLWELKEFVYDKAIENPKDATILNGFECIETVEIFDNFTAFGDEIFSLMQMTPYFYKTPKSAIDKLKTLEKIDTRLEFVIKIFRKI